MSTQTDYNQNPVQFILYYCNYINSDSTIYQIDLSDVCDLYFDGSNNIQISNWQIGGYGAPSTVTILTYTLSNVLAFYNNFYIIPAEIAANEPYMISTSDLANVRADSSMIGFVVYDTTTQSTKYFDGSSWGSTASRYLSSNGGTLNGDLNMNSHNINGITTLYQSTPSAISIWSTSSTSVSYTANTPKLISMGSFTQTVNPNSDFSATLSTGSVQYTGSSTRYFRVIITYSFVSLVPLSTQTLTHYISKNGSTSITGLTTTVTFVALNDAKQFSNTITDIIQLAQNDTVQLGGQYTSTTSITYNNINVTISAL